MHMRRTCRVGNVAVQQASRRQRKEAMKMSRRPKEQKLELTPIAAPRSGSRMCLYVSFREEGGALAQGALPEA